MHTCRFICLWPRAAEPTRRRPRLLFARARSFNRKTRDCLGVAFLSKKCEKFEIKLKTCDSQGNRQVFTRAPVPIATKVLERALNSAPNRGTGAVFLSVSGHDTFHRCTSRVRQQEPITGTPSCHSAGSLSLAFAYDGKNLQNTSPSAKLRLPSCAALCNDSQTSWHASDSLEKYTKTLGKHAQSCAAPELS